MTFQGLKNEKLKNSHVAILPLCFEKTVCGKNGTAKAPLSILEASMDIEFFEEELEWSPFKHINLYTHEDFKHIKNFNKLNKKTKEFINNLNGQFLLTLGGEHSITPFVTKYLLPKKSTIIFFDAHADFRKSYHGYEHSHACALHNLSKQGHEAILIGARSFFDDEKKRLKEQNIQCFSDFDLQKKSKRKELFKQIKKINTDIYVSIDMDFFNPAFVAGVGTPLPGGVDWFLFLKILRKIFKKKSVLGADIVELVPEDSKVSQIIGAKIMQKIFSYWGESKGFKKRAKIGSQTKVEFE